MAQSSALPDELAAAARGGAALSGFLRGLPRVDRAGLERHATALAGRSVKRTAKQQALDVAIGAVDLTTLEGADTADRIRSLCTRARNPDPHQPDAPQVAAICAYPDLVRPAVDALAGSGVRVASVATAFPSGRSSTEVKLAEVRLAVQAGADEIDMVIDRAAFLAGEHDRVLAEIAAVRAECGSRHLKVILETGELATYDNVRRASWLALLGGADFLKTSTGKISPAATLPVTHVLLQAVRDWRAATGQLRGVKTAGGIRSTKDALRYLVAVRDVAGAAWLTPELFRFGASSLLDDLLLQRRAQSEGHYGTAREIPVD
ncbi:deoxyribose-phosphate aldolase [Saccharopolyspora sp. HNM0983]|uniref:Deoxyribose-phosphate aldolase n=1 Tax=Saccharopolyspora montiporae TaxID=2781240 RepID=A0A929B8F8_9PSEU|nr:deoxyribose-phosphate aldolase [Saccharopolyspora sp. HNM0983]MBE9375152.1 deoxyribose-phosphate aldolase [Saccharopolyspora sp. HNM0983]